MGRTNYNKLYGKLYSTMLQLALIKKFGYKDGVDIYHQLWADRQGWGINEKN